MIPPSVDRPEIILFRAWFRHEMKQKKLKKFRMFQCFISAWMMEPCLKWSKIILAAKIILLYFRRDSVLK